MTSLSPTRKIAAPLKRMFLAYSAGVVACLFLLTGCQASRYEPEAEFVDLYADLKLVSVALHDDLERAGEMRRAVLAQHGMTPAEFHEHYTRLTAHPEAWRTFQQRVIARMDAFQENRKDTTHGRERD